MTTYNYAEVHGHKMFHREAGDKSAPAIVLLHGFPTSSHMCAVRGRKRRMVSSTFWRQ